MSEEQAQPALSELIPDTPVSTPVVEDQPQPAAVDNTQPIEVPEVTLANAEQVIQYILAVYAKEKTLVAYNAWVKLQELIAQAEGNPELQQDLEKAKSVIEPHTRLLQRITTEAKQVLLFMAELDNDQGWELSRDDEGVRTYFKQSPDSPTYYIKLKGIVHCPAFSVLACVNEVDFYKRWIPTCEESKIPLNISDFKKLVYLRMVPPSPINWVISPRELLLYGWGVDMMEDNKLAAMARSVTPAEIAGLEEEFNFKAPPERPEVAVRMDCKLAGLLIEPISETQTRVCVLSNSDPQMQLPYWVINLSTKKFAHMIFVYLREKAANLDESYKQRINAEGSVYENIKERLKKN